MSMSPFFYLPSWVFIMAEANDRGSALKPLIGTEYAPIDSKGRIVLDKKMRSRLGDSFAMAIGELGSVYVFPETDWQIHIEEIMKADPLSQARKWYARLFFSTADDEMKCDGQGRVVVPQRLRDLAKLADQVMVVGCGDHFEIWNPDEYEKWEQNQETYGEGRRASMESAFRAMRGL
jgi:MraZ protein